ncbi:MAG: glycosyltransferase, partial [Anaerolineae bacterium]
MTADTGGGHRSVGEAIAEAIESVKPGWCQVIDVAAWAPFPLNQAERLYLPAINYGARVWGWLWHLTDTPGGLATTLFLLPPLLKPGLKRLFKAHQPMVVISVHPLYTSIPVQVLREMGAEAQMITVVTDLASAHRAWFCPDVDLLLVPNQAVRQLAEEYGLPGQKIKVVGLPVQRKFAQLLGSKGAARQGLGLDRELTTILLVGGGEGMGKLFQMAQAIAQTHLGVQLIVVAGRNRRLRQKLIETAWPLPVAVFGFTEDMPRLMQAADIIVTKAGPSTISEALISGLPIILSGAIPGQEAGNVRFVLDSEVGLLVSSPQQLVEVLRDLLRPGNDTLSHMARRARELAYPDAASEAARLITS